MLSVDLGRLGREGSVVLEEQVPPDDGLWKDSGFSWYGPVRVRLRATYAGTGEVVVRGEVSGTLKQECRRCLEPVDGDVREEVTMVFVEADGESWQDEGDAYAFDPKGAELDLSEAVREELILAVDPYVVCDPECRGLCPRCGANWNDGACGCADDEPDPRWEALRSLKNE